MISQGSVSLPVRCLWTSSLNPSLGISFALCNQVALSKASPSRRATLTSSIALLHPTSRSCCFGIRVPREEFDYLLNELRNDLQPVGMLEVVLVDKLLLHYGVTAGC